MANEVMRLGDDDWPVLDATEGWPGSRVVWLLAGYAPPIRGQEATPEVQRQVSMVADMLGSHGERLNTGGRNTWYRRERLVEFFGSRPGLPRPALLYVEARPGWYGSSGTRFDHLDRFTLQDVIEALPPELAPAVIKPASGVMGSMVRAMGVDPSPQPQEVSPEARKAIETAAVELPWSNGAVGRAELRAWCAERGLRPKWLFGSQLGRLSVDIPLGLDSAVVGLPANSPAAADELQGKSRTSALRLIGALVALLAAVGDKGRPELRAYVEDADLLTPRGRRRRLVQLLGKVGVSMDEKPAEKLVSEGLELVDLAAAETAGAP